MQSRFRQNPTLLALVGVASILAAHFIANSVAQLIPSSSASELHFRSLILFALLVGPVIWLAVRRSLNHRVKAEQELAALNRDLASALRRSRQIRKAIDEHAAVAITNPDGTITEIN